ncbi:MAG: DUF2752 domain-containing protein [Opitutales bacterium]|jgi:hypothetical protein
MIRLVRRPLIPGEFDAERWIPPVLVGLGLLAWGFFQLGLTTPACLFRSMTGVPCLACGGTRCVRSLAGLDIAAAFAYSPLVAAAALGAVAWSIWATIARVRGDALRLRLVTDARGSLQLRWAIGVALVLNWIWLYQNLPA